VVLPLQPRLLLLPSWTAARGPRQTLRPQQLQQQHQEQKVLFRRQQRCLRL